MSERSTSPDDDAKALVAEYVLGLLSPSEHERVARLIESSPSLSAERAFWTSHFSALDGEFAEVLAPAHLYGRIENRLFEQGGKKRGSLWDSLALWRGLATAALAVAVLAIGFGIVRPVDTPSTSGPQFVAMLEEAGSDVRFVALYDGVDTVQLSPLAGAAVADRDYELWVIEGGNAPLSMGILSVDAPNRISLTEATLAGWSDDAILAVTLEPVGGGPGGVPTGPVVAKGAVTRI
jgi:anti-sigma-K factor RskA